MPPSNYGGMSMLFNCKKEAPKPKVRSARSKRENSFKRHLLGETIQKKKDDDKK